MITHEKRPTAAHGDKLCAEFTGMATPTATPGVLPIEETASITGGTGRFAGATGSFTSELLYDTLAGPPEEEETPQQGGTPRDRRSQSSGPRCPVRSSNRPARHDVIHPEWTNNRCIGARQHDRTIPIPSHSKEVLQCD